MDKRPPSPTSTTALPSYPPQALTSSSPNLGTSRPSVRGTTTRSSFHNDSDRSLRAVRYRHAGGGDASQADAQGGETLRDFLRNSEQGLNTTTPLPQASESFRRAREDFIRRRTDAGRPRAEFNTAYGSTVLGRKRTSSGAETTGNRRTGHVGNGSSASSPIDLTNSPERSLPRIPSSRNDSRREGEDIFLPSWQADADVFKCPVCDTQFSFWYRKHHCRKCGRVVCANCSPHRITIPRQFIVHPPPNAASPIAVFSGIAGFSDPQDERPISSSRPTLPGGSSIAEPTRRPSFNLTGGEVVRVCNPCVPDPNLSPPPQQHSHPYYPSAHIDPPRYSLDHESSQRTVGRPSLHAAPIPQRYNSTNTRTVPLGFGDATDQRRGSHRYAARISLPPPPPPSTPSAGPSVLLSPTGSNSLSLPSNTYAHRRLSGSTGPSSSTVPLLPPLTLAPPVPRRPQIPEEDECPVCGRELPPKGPSDDESERLRHVQECIALYSTSVPVTSPRAPTLSSSAAAVPGSSAPSSGGHGSPTAAATATATAAAAATATTTTTAAQQALRQRRAHGNRMLVYYATEKDCICNDGDGEGGEAKSAECVICFEEFEVGDEMGRLECLCRFHRACIRQWWDTKGVGSCPTHQLQL